RGGATNAGDYWQNVERIPPADAGGGRRARAARAVPRFGGQGGELPAGFRGESLRSAAGFDRAVDRSAGGRCEFARWRWNFAAGRLEPPSSAGDGSDDERRSERGSH